MLNLHQGRRNQEGEKRLKILCGKCCRKWASSATEQSPNNKIAKAFRISQKQLGSDLEESVNEENVKAKSMSWTGRFFGCEYGGKNLVRRSKSFFFTIAFTRLAANQRFLFNQTLSNYYHWNNEFVIGLPASQPFFLISLLKQMGSNVQCMVNTSRVTIFLILSGFLLLFPTPKNEEEGFAQDSAFASPRM